MSKEKPLTVFRERKFWLLHQASKKMRRRVRKARARRVRYAHELHQRVAEIAKKQIRKKRGLRSVDLVFPAVLCLREAAADTLNFIREADKAFTAPETGRVFVDHAPLQVLGIEAALLLISEFSRLTTYAPKVRLFSKFHDLDVRVEKMLDGIGYFRYYGRSRRLIHQTTGYYVRHTTGTKTDAKASGELLEAFRNSGYLNDLQAKRIGRCIIECLDNVSHHAYPKETTRCLKKRWWLVGYCDRERGELFFAVIDRGVGIAKTLQDRKRDTPPDVIKLLIGRSEEELVVAAFSQSFSRTKKLHRGLGLPGLKRILDEAGRGELFVRTASSVCVLMPGTTPSAKKCDVYFDGTLLAWKLQLEPTLIQ